MSPTAPVNDFKQLTLTNVGGESTARAAFDPLRKTVRRQDADQTYSSDASDRMFESFTKPSQAANQAVPI